jgi:hypothetical protein
MTAIARRMKLQQSEEERYRRIIITTISDDILHTPIITFLKYYTFFA